ncbi:hypothetical protein BROUX41_001636 [Berkeleyomyces rouxiae]|uniref:uncharacterized protein n=1 Tax=Berkeleyomyces rouxiae TaxID=2035830 RepID=UPI003B7BB87E
MPRSTTSSVAAAVSRGSSTSRRGSPGRPGTSGTENLLMTNRRSAATQLDRAKRAEKEYVTHKRATAARTQLTEAKGHYRMAFSQLGKAVRKTLLGAKGVGYIAGEKKTVMRNKREQRQAKRAMEKKEKLEAKLAKRDHGRQSETEEEEDEESDGERRESRRQ